ncbi:MAG: NAD+ synthase [Thaumarchaeota archaeon]|nr:NAD+ synthase [Nitrososphaerota archaeon]
MSASGRTGSRRERTGSTSSSEGGPALGALLRIDYGAAAASSERLVASAVSASGATGAVLGLSGGLDSAVTAAICSRACATTGIIMPDSEVTPRSETEDAQDLAGRLGIAHRTVDIAPIVRELARHVEHDARALGNARARIRMCLLYHHANASRAIVVGTSDRSECLIGYFTKHGDGAADVLPIASLYKTQVRAMAGHLGLPAAIAAKKTAPHPSEGHDAEGELGMAYEEIDAALHCIVDRNMGDAEAAREARVSEETVARVRAMREASAHKRAPAPGACGP